MSTLLKEDICGAVVPGTFATDIEQCKTENLLPQELRYACLYWIQHLQRGGSQVCDSKEVYQFLQAHLLYWLEVLG